MNIDNDNDNLSLVESFGIVEYQHRGITRKASHENNGDGTLVTTKLISKRPRICETNCGSHRPTQYRRVLDKDKFACQHEEVCAISPYRRVVS